MFRKTVTAVAGKDVIAELDQQIEFQKQELKDKPFSPVKRRILNACFVYLSETVNKIGFFNASKIAVSISEKQEIFNQLRTLQKYSDDEFILGVKTLARTLPAEDQLRIILLKEAETAETELKQRRDNMHHYATLTALGATMVLLYQHPLLGLLAFVAEATTILTCDVGRALDNMLEWYDSTGYADVVRNGKTSRELVSTYHEALKDSNNRVETVSLSQNFKENMERTNRDVERAFRMR